MTVAQQTPYSPYVGNGVTTVFPYTFKILDEADLAVYVNGALQTLNVNYSVSGVGLDGGGSVTFLTGAPGSSLSVSIIRAMAVKRLTDYQVGGDFNAVQVNPDFDRAILLIQDVHTQLGRSIRTPADEVGTLPTLPSIAMRAGKFSGFDANGLPTALTGTGTDTALRTDLANGLSGPGADLIAQKRTLTEIARSVVPVNYTYAPGDVRRQGAPTTGLADAGAGIETACNVGGQVDIKGIATYLLASNVDVNVAGTEIRGENRSSTLLLSGNNRRAFSVSVDKVLMENLFINGQKPTVGYETANNFDFGAYVGEFATALMQRFTWRNSVIQDVGLDGILIANVQDALIENMDFINCRRAGIAAVAGTYGIKNLTIRGCRFFCDFAGGPVGKERPLFAWDIEPDAPNAPTDTVIIEDFYVHQGRASAFSNPAAIIKNCVIRDGDIVGTFGALVIDANAPLVSDINLFDGAYALIDNAVDSFPAQPYISNLKCFGRTPKVNADGRVNLLPRDCIALADGTLSIGGTGSTSYTSLNLDGVPSSVTNFAIGIGVGNANVTIPSTVSIATDDNVWVVLKVNVTAGSLTQACIRVSYGTTINRTLALGPGEQWIVIAVRATGADVNPDFFFGVSGNVTVATSIRCTLAQVLINPALVDMPAMKVRRSSLSKTFAGWTGPTLDAYNRELCALNAAGAQNLDAINGCTDQIVGLQSVGAGVITLRDTGTSGVTGPNGGIKLSGGGTVALTNATLRRHSDGFWYRV